MDQAVTVGPIAIQHRTEILAQVAQGTMLQTIAKSLGIAAPNISKHLANDPEYRKAREIGAELRLHQAFIRMEECAEGKIIEDEESGERVLIESKGNLARAREAAFRAAAWFAEREFPQRWGQKSELNVSIDITAALADARQRAGRVIDAEQQVQCNIESGRTESDNT